MRVLVLVFLVSAGSLLANPVEFYSTGEGSDRIVHFREEVPTPSEFDELMHKDMGCPVIPVVVDPRLSSSAGVTLDLIINLGTKVWKVIEKNKPVVDIKTTYANALPSGVRSAAELESFSDVQAKSYRMHGKNTFNSTVYDVTYTLLHRYGGTYKGRGRYLEGVTIFPSKVDVLWGYKVNLDVNSVSAVNLGTQEAPVGGVAMEMNFAVNTTMKSHSYRAIYQFRGDNAKAKIAQ